MKVFIQDIVYYSQEMTNYIKEMLIYAQETSIYNKEKLYATITKSLLLRQKHLHTTIEIVCYVFHYSPV